jgi:hypothetical protein
MRARNALVARVHQDVDLPARWDRLMLNPYRMTERRCGPIGVAGVCGVGPVADWSARVSLGGAGGLAARRIGWVEGWAKGDGRADRHNLLKYVDSQ